MKSRAEEIRRVALERDQYAALLDRLLADEAFEYEEDYDEAKALRTKWAAVAEVDASVGEDAVQ